MRAPSMRCLLFVHFNRVYDNIGTFLHSQRIARVEGRVGRRKGRRMEEKKNKKKERWKGRWKDGRLLHILEVLNEF